MTWDLSSDNTNPATLTEASLGPFVSQATAIYHCPSDRALSAAQSAAGWDRRDPQLLDERDGRATPATFQQVVTTSTIPITSSFSRSRKFPSPAKFLCFWMNIRTRINDGYFLNKSTEYASGGSYGGQAYSYGEWLDLPATYHNNSTAFSFADGHSTLHRWMIPSTSYPVQPDVPYLPIPISANQRGDFDWILDHMSVDHD